MIKKSKEIIIDGVHYTSLLSAHRGSKISQTKLHLIYKELSESYFSELQKKF